MNKSALRISQIEMILKERYSMPAKEPSDAPQMLEMTIRRGLEILINNNSFIRSIRGLLVYDASQSLMSGTYNIVNAKDANLSNKIAIGQKVASVVEDSDVIIIDLGFITEHLAHTFNASSDATIICVSCNVPSPPINKSNLRIYYPGGFLHADIQIFESTGSLSFLKNTRAKKFFASAAGIYRDFGVIYASNYEAVTKKTLLQASAERIFLADSSKFDQVEIASISEIENCHTVITDGELMEGWGEYLNEKGITVMKA